MHNKTNLPSHPTLVHKFLMDPNPLTRRVSLTTSKFFLSFALAGLATGINWYLQRKLTQAQISKQKQIQNRVINDTTITLPQLLDIQNSDLLQGTKIKVTGQLEKGRMIIKRKRGHRDGYMVLAPFVVIKKQTGHKNRPNFTLNLKFMLNLGWVPKDSKHQIKQCAANDVLAYDQLPEEMLNLSDPPTRSTITAYVKKGERKDVFRGYNNFVEDQLYKFVDLPFLEGVYNSVHPSFRHVYLDRADEKNSESFPFPNTKQLYQEQIKEEIEYIKKKRQNFTFYGGVAAFASATLLTLL